MDSGGGSFATTAVDAGHHAHASLDIKPMRLFLPSVQTALLELLAQDDPPDLIGRGHRWIYPHGARGRWEQWYLRANTWNALRLYERIGEESNWHSAVTACGIRKVS